MLLFVEPVIQIKSFTSMNLTHQSNIVVQCLDCYGCTIMNVYPTTISRQEVGIHIVEL